MINSDNNSNGLGNNVTGVANFHKQSPIATKKVALREVHNNGRSLLPNVQETSVLLEGRALTVGTKVSGTKRPTFDHSSAHTSPPSLINNATNDHFMHTRRKLESEIEKRKIPVKTPTFIDFLPSLNETNMHCPPPITQPNYNASARAYSNSATPLVPNFFGNSGNIFSKGTQFKGTSELRRRERQNQLQDYIKYCDDESTQAEHVQRLLHLSPAELSRHAVELEKRAIQLTIEEGKEIKRMKALNVLEKSASTKA